MRKNEKIKILGAGPTGSLAALALAGLGFDVVIYDTKTSSEIQKRSRAYALTYSSRKLLIDIGIWENALLLMSPFKSVYIKDLYINKSFTFNSEDLPIFYRDNPVGWIVEHEKLMQFLHNNLSLSSRIITRFHTETDLSLKDFKYLIAADGPNSSTRDLLGISNFTYNYREACLTFKALIRGASANTAYEFFTPEGPLALLPINRDLYQIVWSSQYSICKKRELLSTSAFLDRLASVLPKYIQPDVLINKPMTFGSKISLSWKYYRNRILLIGESSHKYHPVGGQGLNICWRDVDELRTYFKKYLDSGLDDKNLLRSYTKSRTLDLYSMGVVTHLLISIFSNRNIMLLPFKNIIFYLLNKSLFLRRTVLRIMTFGPSYLNKKIN
tara:strand:- start:3680 stop:4831 length:1152 start_codon:yes stop_codon:yes gene_type:complete